MTKNKFVKSPYLPHYDKIDLWNLERILEIISKTCCEFKSPKGVIREIQLLTNRPSTVRKCDLYFLKPIIKASKNIKEFIDFENHCEKIMKERGFID